MTALRYTCCLICRMRAMLRVIPWTYHVTRTGVHASISTDAPHVYMYESCCTWYAGHLQYTHTVGDVYLNPGNQERLHDRDLVHLARCTSYYSRPLNNFLLDTIWIVEEENNISSAVKLYSCYMQHAICSKLSLDATIRSSFKIFILPANLFENKSPRG
jgi:hypothetical protein